jgi:hypothetical protein
VAKDKRRKERDECAFDLHLGKKEARAVMVEAIQGKKFEVLLEKKEYSRCPMVDMVVCVLLAQKGEIRARIVCVREAMLHDQSDNPARKLEDVYTLTLQNIESKPK